MKSINAKRIAAVAASLLVGLAAAGQGVTFGNIPIINTQGQPVVQIVVGSTAQPSDGVVAANIAAVIGSLSHTSTNVTATVSGRSNVKCVVTTPTCTLSNQQVWLGEQGLVVPTGSYSFTALIGSVLNPGVLSSGNLVNTKSLQGASGTNYDYVDPTTGPYAITSSPTATSVFAGIGTPSPQPTVSAGTNGGGISFSRFTSSPLGYDNVLQLTSAQVPGLQSNSGTYQETASLWLAGFPVFNQATGVLSLLDTNGAYLVTFGKPIQVTSGGTATNAQFTLLGANWSVYGMTVPTSITGVTSNSFVVGGNVTLAQASTPVQTVYVGHNITSGPFTVVLNDLSYPNQNGISNAALSIYNNGVLTNVTSAGPASNQNIVVNSSGTKLYVKVSQTFPGLYAYQKWAKIQLFSNTVNVTSGKNFNSANGNNWLVGLRWTTNQSSTAAATSANAALQGIVLYSNQSTQTIMTPGTSYQFITSPARWSVNFAGDSLGAPSSGNSNYDALSFSTGYSSATTYSNLGAAAGEPFTANHISFATTSGGTSAVVSGFGGAAGTVQQLNTTVVTEPVNQFVVQSSIPTAFQVTSTGSLAAPSSNLQSLTYNLDPYQLDKSLTPNVIDAASAANILASPNGGLAVELIGGSGLNANIITASNPLNVQLTGYQPGKTSATTYTFSFQGAGSAAGNWLVGNGLALGNLTNIQLSAVLPNPGVSVYVFETGNTAQLNYAANAVAFASSNSFAQNAFVVNSVELGALTYSSTPTLLYSVPQYSYKVAPTVSTLTYTGEQNNVNFAISTSSFSSAARNQFFTYTMPEITVPGSTSPNANVILGITNTSTVVGYPTPAYWLNISNSNNNAVTYQSSQNNQVKAVQGFRTERGGDVASVSTTALVYDEPKSIDGLQFIVGAASVSSNTATTTKLAGPYGVGQATNLANVTIGKVNATCAFTTSSCNVSGLANLTAVPSVTQAVVPTTLNTATTPLAVLDSNANSASTLIVVGSKYVNSVAGQIFAQNPSFNSTFGQSSVVVQAFGANRVLVAGYSAAQTVTAGNQFIQALLANATV